MIRVELPAHLRTLAGVKGEVTLDVAGPVTLRAVLDALEAAYPMLQGTIREHGTLKRRAFLRFSGAWDIEAKGVSSVFYLRGRLVT